MNLIKLFSFSVLGIVVAWMPLFAGVEDPLSCLSYDWTSSGVVPCCSGFSDAKVYGDVTFSSGRIGKAAFFRQTPGWLEWGLPSTPNHAFSLSMWMRYDSGGQTLCPVVSKKGSLSGSNYECMVGIINLGFRIIPYCQIMIGGKTRSLLGFNHTVNARSWNHVVLTYDGSSVAFYLNGKIVQSLSASGTVFPSGYPFVIGNNPDWIAPGMGLFSGMVDETRLYPFALNQTMVSDLRALSRFPLPEAKFTESAVPDGSANEVVFDASASASEAATIVLYSWDFGDGQPVQTSETASIRHKFGSTGAYDVVLTVTDSRASSSSVSKPITVSAYGEKDPVFTSSVAASILSADMDRWNAAFSWGDHHLSDYVTQSALSSLIPPPVSGLAFQDGLLTLRQGENSHSVEIPISGPGLDPDPTNELNHTLLLDGTRLQLQDAGGTLGVDLGPLFQSDSSLSSPDGLVTEALSVLNSGQVVASVPMVIDVNDPPSDEALLHVKGSVVVEGELIQSVWKRKGDIYMGQFGRTGDQSPEPMP